MLPGGAFPAKTKILAWRPSRPIRLIGAALDPSPYLSLSLLSTFRCSSWGAFLTNRNLVRIPNFETITPHRRGLPDAPLSAVTESSPDLGVPEMSATGPFAPFVVLERRYVGFRHVPLPCAMNPSIWSRRQPHSPPVLNDVLDSVDDTQCRPAPITPMSFVCKVSRRPTIARTLSANRRQYPW